MNLTCRLELVEIGLRFNRRQARPLARDKPEVSPKRLRQQKDISKQNRRIKAIAADRLQRHFRRKLAIVAQRQEIARLGPSRAIFRKVTPRLPHHPDWRRFKGFAGQSPQDFLFLSHGHPHISAQLAKR